MDIQPITISIGGVDYTSSITEHDPFVIRPIQDQTPWSFVLADSAAAHLPSIIHTTVSGSRCVASRDQDGIVDTIVGFVNSSSWLDGVARFSMSNEVAEYTSSRDRITSAEDQAKYSIDGLPVDRIFDEMSGSSDHAEARLNWTPR